MGAIRDRFEKLPVVTAGYPSPELRGLDVELLKRDDVLKLADELDRERAALVAETEQAVRKSIESDLAKIFAQHGLELPTPKPSR